MAIVHAEEQTLRPRIAQTASGVLRPGPTTPTSPCTGAWAASARSTPSGWTRPVRTKGDGALAAKKCDEAATRLMAAAGRPAAGRLGDAHGRPAERATA
jgi:hypothetical protein